MARVVSLYFPTWPTDRLRRVMGAAAPATDQPLVVVGRDGRRRGIVALDARAAALGLRIGMPISKAQALVAHIVKIDADPIADAEALERLALWALQRFSPIVATDLPDGIVMDIAGAAHLHSGEDALVEKIIDRMQAAGIAVRIALADSWGAAHALARFHSHPAVVAPPGEGAKAILDLPIAALRLPGDIIEGLRVLGFATIGELAAKPRAPLALRFGPELSRRIDQALGRIGEPIEPIRSAEIIEVRKPFAEPIGAAETIAKYIGKLVIELCKALEAQGLGARRLDLLLYRVDNQIEVVRIGTALPTRDLKRLTRMLVDKIGSIDPGFGIEVMTLTASTAEPLDLTQAISSLIDEPEADVSALIDTLTNRIGEASLYRFAPVASDVPERSVQRVAPMSLDDGQSWPAHWPRPTRLLLHPERIETVALLPDHPPVAFTWRGIRRRVKRADGPERVFGEWWKRDAELAAVRDYFQVEDEGGERFWIYRAGDGEDAATGSHRWFLHGIFG